MDRLTDWISIGDNFYDPFTVGQKSHFHPIVGMNIHLIECIDHLPAEIAGTLGRAARQFSRHFIIFPQNQMRLFSFLATVVISYFHPFLVLRPGSQGQT